MRRADATAEQFADAAAAAHQLRRRETSVDARSGSDHALAPAPDITADPRTLLHRDRATSDTDSKSSSTRYDGYLEQHGRHQQLYDHHVPRDGYHEQHGGSRIDVGSFTPTAPAADTSSDPSFDFSSGACSGFGPTLDCSSNSGVDYVSGVGSGSDANSRIRCKTLAWALRSRVPGLTGTTVPVARRPSASTHPWDSYQHLCYIHLYLYSAYYS